MREKIAEIISDFFWGESETYIYELADQIIALLPDISKAIEHGARLMAAQIRDSIETGKGVFADEMDENGDIKQSDANWILNKFRELPDISRIEVVEKCPECGGISFDCTQCNGTGEIVRAAEWGNIDIMWMIKGYQDNFIDIPTKSGGRLRVKE